ncbi:hypothetical protein CYLTODRAFT_457565 [Cylindrobasidium torrendii FP15055 ss-10]|uniref:C4-dicarboxylate transporter/malic acid transport protein n=1 Tax=Cylindrobasidium torrendii FP15055 ss-10 TaxID=1314674 RepID=A0A0D7B1I7_9AGAR|nr:hypothetical protein CYLTODRAFT_457565 [Cylindrobasidium torrendii FP15055 ss-10]
MAADTIPRNKTFKDVIRNFGPAWFSVNMGIGAMSTLFHAYPYGSNLLGMKFTSLGFLLFNITSLLVFLSLTIARYTLWPDIWHLMLRHPAKSMFTGTFPMGLATILSASVQLVNQDFNVGGKALLYTLWGLWWMDSALSVVCCWGILHMMKTTQNHTLDAMSAVWLLPGATVIVAASVGVSLFMLCVGLTMAFMILTVYLLRLILHDIPSGAGALSVFLPLGPMGQGGFAVLLMGQYFRDFVGTTDGANGESDFLGQPDTARIVYIACVCLAFCLWSLATMWAVWAVMGIQQALRAKIEFKIGAWGLIFPNGVYANLSIALADTLDSPFFRVYGAVYGAGVILLWACIAARTLVAVYSKEIFEAPCLEEMDLGKAVIEEHGSEPKPSSTTTPPVQ